jgi:hypothetical protein
MQQKSRGSLQSSFQGYQIRYLELNRAVLNGKWYLRKKRRHIYRAGAVTSSGNVRRRVVVVAPLFGALIVVSCV